MSGFFGILRTDGSLVEKDFLDRIASALKFRGPDGTSVCAKGSVGFSFAFLDTETPHQSRCQPVQLGERFWLAGQVRLDARKELVADLRGKGLPAVNETTDEGLALLAWDAWGETCLKRLLGDFSFGLWDAHQRAFFCARDFAGPRPFFYAEGPGIFCFTNTLEVFHYVPEISRDFDDLFIQDFLKDGLSSDRERTVWRSVRRLPSGHRLKFSEGKLDVKRFLELPIEEPLRWKRPEEYLENFRELLRVAVADRLPAGKTSLYLSGGLDSATVCATAVRVASEQGSAQNLRAFTISWRPLLDDHEPSFAALTARHLGLPNEILGEGRIVPYDGMELPATPEPISEVFFGRACRLYQEIAAHSRVVLSGDGGDDVLLGEAWPYLRYLCKRGEWGAVVSIGRYFAAHGRFPPVSGGFRSGLRRLFRRKHGPQPPPAWFAGEFSDRVRAQTATIHTHPDSLPVHPLHPGAYRSLHSGYWSNVLEDEDAGWTGVSLETRAPFLDQRLLRFLLRLPPVPWCMDKELTRKAMVALLPEEILKRPKAPLARDPLEACRGTVSSVEIAKNPPQRINEFVKWSPWLATLQNPAGSLTWENSYPLSFALWLKAIENRRWIQ